MGRQKEERKRSQERRLNGEKQRRKKEERKRREEWEQIITVRIRDKGEKRWENRKREAVGRRSHKRGG